MQGITRATKEQISSSDTDASDPSKERVVSPTEKHTHTVIFLHGRGDNASQFAEDFLQSQGSDKQMLPAVFPSFKWVFPTSKMRYSVRFKEQMTQWFDMWSTEEPDERKEMQEDGIKESAGLLMAIIAREAEEISLERIILGGISQGCATAIYALIFGASKLGGFIGLCSWLPVKDDIEEKTLRSAALNNALQTPVFLSHSKDDIVVPIRNGKKLYHGLKAVGISSITWKEYEKCGGGQEDGHWIHEPQGIDDMVVFMQQIVAKST